MPGNVADTLAEQAAAHPQRVALVDALGTLSTCELHRESLRLASGLLRVGFRPSVRVAVMVPPGREFVALTFAMLKAGVVPVLIDPGMGLRGLKRCLHHADVAGFIGSRKALLARRLFGWVRGATTVHAGRRRSLSRHATGTFPKPVAVPDLSVTADTIAAILFTSGSTGPAKGVVYTHGMFAAQIASLKSTFDFRPGEVDFCTFPLFALFAPALGMTSVVPVMDASRPGRADVRDLAEQVHRHGATNFFGSPAVLKNWASAPGLAMPTLRRVISAGAPATPAVIEAVARRLTPGAEVFTPYGATECLPVASAGSGELIAETFARTSAGAGVCVGKPVAGVTVRIIPQSNEAVGRIGEALGVGEVGEICVKSALASREYWRDEAATKRAKIPDADGTFWHRMGDVGYFDAAGRLWFCGRKAHVVWTPAGPLYPDQVEPVLNQVGVRTALVGVELGGVTVPVVCYESGRRGRAAIEARLRARAVRFGVTAGVRHFVRHPGFPVDVRHNAKIARERLAEWVARHRRLFS